MADLDTLPGWLIAMNLWTAGLLVVAIALDALLARRLRPAWRVALYATVVVRLALPANWQSPLGAFEGRAPTTSAAVVGLVAPDAPALIGALDPPGGASLEASAGSETTRRGPETPPLGVIVVIAWLSIAMTLLAAMVVVRRTLARRLAEGVPARVSVRRLAGSVAVLEHATLGPLTYGASSPRIVLPRALVDELSDRELGHVVAHELAHVRRRDGLLAVAMTTSCALLWPILPLWIAAARVRRLIELAADEQALADATSSERIAFGHTLLRLAGAPRARAGALAMGGYRDLHGRIRALRATVPLPRGLQLCAVGLAIAIPLACAGHADRFDPSQCDDLKATATAAHDRAENGERELAGAASTAYDTFAEHCVAHPDRGDVMYYRAELRWAIAHDLHRRGVDSRAAFASAHAAFLESLDAGSERFEIDAATAQMLSKRAELGIAPRPLAPRDDEGAGPRRGKLLNLRDRTDYDEDERSLLASYDTFETHVDDLEDPDLQRVLYHRASLAMDHLRFDEARPPLERLLAADGEEIWHVGAAEMLVDVLTIAWTDPDATEQEATDSGEALVQLCERLPKMALWRHAEAGRLHEAVPTLRAGVLWKSAMRQAAAGDPLGCGEAFDGLAREHSEHPRRDEMLWNGARCFRDGGRSDRALALERTLLTDHPSSEHAEAARALVSGD